MVITVTGPRIQPGTGAYSATTTLWIADRSGTRRERLPLDVHVHGTIDYNEDRLAKRSLALEVNNPPRLTPFADYLIPETTLTDASGISRTQAWGHFLVTPPKETLTASRFSGVIQGQDLTWLLAMDTVPSGTVIPAGTDTGEAARDIALAVLDAAQLALPDTGVLLVEDYTPEAGASRLAVMTDLLATGNHYAPYMTGAGAITTTPMRDLHTAQPVRTLSSRGGATQVVPPVTSNPDWDRLRNRITVVVQRPNESAITATAEVTNPDSPVHPEQIGGDPTRPLWLSETVNDPQVADEAAALVRAELLLANAASWYRRLNVQTVLDLDAGAHDVVALDIVHNGASYTGNWLRRAWTVDLRGVTALTSMNLTRTEQWQ